MVDLGNVLVDEELARVRTTLTRALDNAFRVSSISDLRTLSEVLDSYLLQLLRQLVAKESASVIPGASYKPPLSELCIDGVTYEVRAGENTRKGHIVELAFVQREPTVSDTTYDHRLVKLPGHGKYQQASLWLPKGAQFDRDWFGAVTTAIFGTGYAWFEEQCLRTVTDAAQSLGADLFGCLRPVVPNEKLLERFWFGAGSKSFGFFVLDYSLATTALRVLASASPKLGQSPFRLLSELLGTEIPVEKTFAWRAVAEDKCLDVDLTASQYREDVPLLARAEMEVLDSKSVTFCPIARHDRAYLVAIFPTANKESLLPILRQQGPELEQRFRRAHTRLPRLLAEIRRQPADTTIYSAAGQFVGNVLKALM